MTKVVVLNYVRERTAPNVGAFSPKAHPAGTVIELSDTIYDDKGDLWGIVANQERSFVAIYVRGKTYCSEINNTTPNAQEWMQAIDAWARTKGYMGPKP